MNASAAMAKATETGCSHPLLLAALMACVLAPVLACNHLTTANISVAMTVRRMVGGGCRAASVCVAVVCAVLHGRCAKREHGRWDVFFVRPGCWSRVL